MTADSVRRALRTFVIAFAGLFLPGLVGFLHEVTQWANAGGQEPFPDARSLGFLGIAAITAGVVAVVNWVWNIVEDAAGAGFLRDVPPGGLHRGQRGDLSPAVALLIVGVVGLVVWWATGIGILGALAGICLVIGLVLLLVGHVR